ncbi:uncharacterized protein N7443_010399 [Penicillium atrosanguineum]|uniref:uncharacterized protein n=1 Tax=Penicillium atrosanguineum TaxID=1132637 RepID=UPI0023A328B1|nr:uncharacterized protein N7443_010399 [Penicillium atrosanguineum]KAJ5290146.1 hypothetical protein N7443_010399 [Penicillium atrosanguineum]
MSTTQGKSGHRNPIHNPFPASLSSECKKAGKIIYSFVNSTLTNTPGETAIPRKILGTAKGLVICTVFRAGFLGSIRFGSGLMVARLPDGSWSAPSAIALGGLGGGGQFGVELTDFVFVLNTDAAVQTFLRSGNITMSGNISVAFGPGRSAETGAIIGTSGMAGIFAYSKTRGVYGGATLEGSVILERSSANKKMYERKLKAIQLLNGEIPPPPEAEPLMHILNSEAFRLQPSVGTSDAVELPADILSEPVQRPSELALESPPVPELSGQSSHQEMPSGDTREEDGPQEIAGPNQTAQSQEATVPQGEAESREATRSPRAVVPEQATGASEASMPHITAVSPEGAAPLEVAVSPEVTVPRKEATNSQEATNFKEAMESKEAIVPHDEAGQPKSSRTQS